MNERASELKATFLGDCTVGKTCLVKRLVEESIDKDLQTYTPTVFSTYKRSIVLPLKTVTLNAWDSSGDEKFAAKRPAMYPNTNAFMVCFDMTNFESWTNVQKTVLFFF